MSLQVLGGGKLFLTERTHVLHFCSMQPPVCGQKGGRTEALLTGFTAEVDMMLGQLTGQHVLRGQGVVALLGK
jgi:hypothetical protein